MPARRNLLLPSEHAEQTLLFEWAHYATARAPELGLLFAIPNFSGRLGKATARHGGSLNREGRKKGVPDVFLPVARGPYHGLFLEMKRLDGGRLSPEQRSWIDALRSMDYRVEVCAGWEQAKRVLCEYLGVSL